ncbi:MAG: hypothetical protein ABEJ72_06745, partial [Candidatus Aenigmatarchaeota archaeon]
IDTDENTLDLSLKRVNDNQKRDAMQRWNKEKKAEKFVEELAERLGEDKEDLYEKVVFPMQEEFGSAFTGFEIAVGREEDLKEMFDAETVEAIQEVARENINLKQEKLEGEIEVRFNQGDGVERIRDTFSKFGDGVEVNYVSAPKYSITAWGRNMDLAKERMDEAVKKFREKAEELDGEFKFEKA